MHFPTKKIGVNFFPDKRPNQGGGVTEGNKKPNPFFGKVFFQWACRIILGPPKHVLHLVWSAYVLSTAIRTALKVARTAQILRDRRLSNYNTVWSKFRSKFFFWLKFVLAIVDEIFNKKNGGQSFSGKKDQTWGGGPEGSLVKDHTFPPFFWTLRQVRNGRAGKIGACAWRFCLHAGLANWGYSLKWDGSTFFSSYFG